MPKYALAIGSALDSKLENIAQSKSNPATDRSDIIRRGVALYSFLHRRGVALYSFLHEKLDATPGAKVAIIGSKNEILLLIDPLP